MSVAIKTRITEYICRTCGRNFRGDKPKRETHIDQARYDRYSTMDDCEKPKIVKVVYVSQEITPVQF